MKFCEKFPEMLGVTWGRSMVDLGDDEIAHVDSSGTAYTRPRKHSYSLSWEASRLPDGRVFVVVQDNSASEDDYCCESGEITLPTAG